MKQVMKMIRSALSSAMKLEETTESPMQLHRERSRNWVEFLAGEFRNYYHDDLSTRVFSKHYDGNREEFLLNELLFDICVCRVGEVASNKHKKKLYYIKDVLWQIESEFAKNSRQALVDFNKLVLGAAKNKLFIGPHVHNTESFVKVLQAPASVCSGSVFLCLLPHPAQWDIGNNAPINLWEFSNGQWEHYKE